MLSTFTFIGGDPVTGPASSTDNAIPRFDGTGGDALQDSGVTIDDSDNLTVPGNATVTGVVTSDTIPIWRGEGALTGNLAIGPNALTSASLSGGENVVISPNSGTSITSGQRNVVVGSDSGQAITTGNENVFVGRRAGRFTTTGARNLAFGTIAFENNTTGSDNMALGGSALFFTTSGASNSAVGFAALAANTTGRDNIGIGRSTGNTTGNYNVRIGNFAQTSATSGDLNAAIGHNAGRRDASGANVTTNSYCIYIGAETRTGAIGAVNEIVIGSPTNGAQPATTWAEGKGSNTTVIGNTSATEFWAYGDHHLDTYDIVTDTTTGTKIGTGATQKLGFWNATPIAQPDTGVASAAFVAGTGTGVNDDSTFDGYTIQQVVKALRNAGLLA